MISKIIEYLQKNHIMMYLLLGALTTAVNYIVYFPLYNILDLSAYVSNMIAWVVSVVVAFATNKPLVFESFDWTLKVSGPEFLRFVVCRLGSGALETAVIYVMVDMLCWNGNLMKLIVSVFVVILNYIGSKLLVFRRKKEA